MKRIIIITLSLCFLISCSSDDKEPESTNDTPCNINTELSGKWKWNKSVVKGKEDEINVLLECNQRGMIEFKEDCTYSEDLTSGSSNGDCTVENVKGTYTVKTGNIIETIENPNTDSTELRDYTFEISGNTLILIDSVLTGSPLTRVERRTFYNKKTVFI